MKGDRVSEQVLSHVHSAILNSSDVYQPDHRDLSRTLIADPTLPQEACNSMLQALGVSSTCSSLCQGAQRLQALGPPAPEPCAHQQSQTQISLDAAQILDEAWRSWQLDSFALEEATTGNALTVLVGWLIAKEDLGQKLQLDNSKLQSFLIKIRQG